MPAIRTFPRTNELLPLLNNETMNVGNLVYNPIEGVGVVTRRQDTTGWVEWCTGNSSLIALTRMKSHYIEREESTGEKSYKSWYWKLANKSYGKMAEVKVISKGTAQA